MSYVRHRRPAGLGALLIPTTTTVAKLATPTTTIKTVAPAPAPAPTPIPVKVVAPAPAPVPVTSTIVNAVASMPKAAPIDLVVPAAPAPTFVNPIASLPKVAPIELVQPAPVPAQVVAPTFVNPTASLPKAAPIDLVMPIPEPTFTNPIASLPKGAPVELVQPVVTAPVFVNPIASLPKEAPLSLVQPAVVAPPAPVATPSGTVAPKSIVGANCTVNGKQGTVQADGTCRWVYQAPVGAKGTNPMSVITDALKKKREQDKRAGELLLQQQRAAMAGRPCTLTVNGKKIPGLYNAQGKCLQKIAAKPLPPGRAVGLRGRVPGAAPSTNLAAAALGLRSGGQVASPSVVAANCGPGQRLVNGACQADPGTTISPTTGTVAQPAQASPTSVGPVTYSQWSARDGQTMMGPAPTIESTPAEDEAGVPPVPPPAGMSTGTKVAMGLGAAIVGFFVLKGLGVFRP